MGNQTYLWFNSATHLPKHTKGNKEMQHLLHCLGVQQAQEEMKSFISLYHPESLHSVFHHHDTGERPLLSKHPENVSQEERGERGKKKKSPLDLRFTFPKEPIYFPCGYAFFPPPNIQVLLTTACLKCYLSSKTSQDICYPKITHTSEVLLGVADAFNCLMNLLSQRNTRFGSALY